MNVVPGVPTNFWMKPIITTAEMKEILRKEGRKDVDTWDYYVYCNKICGSAHYNMKIKMVVETEAEYNKWLSTQKSTYASMMGIEKPASETPNAVPADSAKAESQKTAMK
jgi:cytochrome c oxidase subunit 2